MMASTEVDGERWTELRDIYLGGKISCQKVRMDRIWREREESRMMIGFLREYCYHLMRWGISKEADLRRSGGGQNLLNFKSAEFYLLWSYSSTELRHFNI